MQAQVGVGGIDRRRLEIGDVYAQGAHVDTADLVVADPRVDARNVDGHRTEGRRRVPDIKDGLVGVRR